MKRILLVSFAAFALASQNLRAEDLAAHCASVGDDDRTAPIPAALAPKAVALFGFSASAVGFVAKSTVYRCMGAAPWLCNFGANLTCAKADVSRTSTGAEAFCRQNPGAAVVPMAATGHDTIFSWKCVGDRPVITNAEKVDRRGFIANQWKRLTP
jgi:hypothetical protein